MTPQQLYDTIKQAYPQYEVGSICFTNKDCKRDGFCAEMQTGNVIDFDAVKETKYKGQAPTPASVDAVCVANIGEQIFTFVELKGWQKYIDNIYHQKCTPEEISVGYNLAGKLSGSQCLCMELTSDNELFSDMRVQFLLVTDLDTKTRGIDAFHTMLNLLGQSSTHIYSECIRQANIILDTEIYIDKAYISCKEFTSFINNHR